MTTVPAFELSVVQSTTTDYVDGRTQGYRVKLVCSVVRGFHDPAVFLFQRISDNRDEFVAICRPADLADFQVNAPDEQGWLRLAEADLVFASKAEALEILDAIMADLKILCDEMAKIDQNISVIGTVSVASDATIDV